MVVSGSSIFAYTPRTNGKAERFIQTALREWACSRVYESSEQRVSHLPLWLHQYNWHRPHAGPDYLPPISRLPSMNNLWVYIARCGRPFDLVNVCINKINQKWFVDKFYTLIVG